MTRFLDSRWIAAKQFMAAEQQKLAVGKLDRLSRDFLDWIVVRSQMEKPLHIQEIVMESDIASPATVHKSIDVLENAKLIDVVIDETDQRRRLVRPTALALEEVKALDKSFQAWIRRSKL
jgi:DNA-binding MarR family transcriptional regulator